MSDEGRKPGWPWIAAVLIGLPMLYVASFGPACWIVARPGRIGEESRIINSVYWPIGWLADCPVSEYPKWPLTSRVIYWYAGLFIPEKSDLMVDAGEGRAIQLTRIPFPRTGTR
jgi:hypothetical protein